MQTQKQKLFSKNSYELILAVLFVFACVSLSAFIMKVVEKNIIHKTSAQVGEMNEKKSAINSVSEFFNVGFLKKGQVLGMATEKEKYQAELVNQAFPGIRIYPNKSITFWVDFKNKGTETWKNNGDHFIALNVSNPAGRQSPFKHDFWQEYYYRPTRLLNEEVKPGEVGRFRFALKALETPGNYIENFGLVAEDLEWIKGGKVSIPIEVVSPYEAELVGKSSPGILIKPGKSITFWVDFKNKGTETWKNNGDHFIALNVSNPAGRQSPFKHDFWQEYYYRPCRLGNTEVKPGETGRFKFAIKAPETEGNYLENFGLVAENLEWIKGGEVSIPIEVKKEETILPPAITYQDGEPDIKIGLFHTEKLVIVKATGPYQIKDNQDNLLTEVNREESSVEFIKGQYHIKAPGYSKTLNDYVKFVPLNQQVVIEISSFENYTDWDKSINDNRFRGTIEVRYSATSRKVWVINELPLETYLRGIGEANGSQPKEYLKALLTAARTYAMYHIQTNGLKHKGDNFILDPTANDQIYRGYNIELRSPEITQAVMETSGQMVTFENEVVITPYFSHSDGRTRSWTEVWAGVEKAWLVSKPDPCCYNLDLWGHGVGLSGMGARLMAKNGKTWEQILKYYYTDVEIKKIY